MNTCEYCGRVNCICEEVTYWFPDCDNSSYIVVKNGCSISVCLHDEEMSDSMIDFVMKYDCGKILNCIVTRKYTHEYMSFVQYMMSHPKQYEVTKKIVYSFAEEFKKHNSCEHFHGFICSSVINAFDNEYEEYNEEEEEEFINNID